MNPILLAIVAFGKMAVAQEDFHGT